MGLNNKTRFNVIMSQFGLGLISIEAETETNLKLVKTLANFSSYHSTKSSLGSAIVTWSFIVNTIRHKKQLMLPLFLQTPSTW